MCLIKSLAMVLFPLSIGDRATVGALWQKPSTPMKTLTIDVVSDVVCPWCYIGKRRLERALALLAVQHPDVDPEVRWHTFQLNPDMAPEGIARADYVSKKFGDEATAIYDRVAGVGKEVGIPFAFDKISRQPNTVVAHSLIAVSEPGMQQDAMVEAFFKAYFLEGKDLTEASVLMDIAESAGMDRAVAEAHLQNSELHSQTIDSDKAAREMGITGVPFFIFNRQVGLSGAHEAETLLQGMEEAMNAATDD
jgi:predicted DsbA family dithiol-disulfide isomerase